MLAAPAAEERIMVTTTCLCGASFSAGDIDGLVPVMLDHCQQVHPELGLAEVNVRDFLEAEQRLAGAAVERLPVIGSLAIEPVSPNVLPELLDFFDLRAFAGHPAWAGCYCMCHHVAVDADPPWMLRCAADNRSDLAARIAAGATTGVIARVDGEVAGWCNATARSAFPEHRGQTGEADARVGAVVCFVIAPPYRRHGLARRLLEGACTQFRAQGFALAEGYPRRHARPGDAGAYHGPLALFLDSGFREVASTEHFHVVQKPLV